MDGTELIMQLLGHFIITKPFGERVSYDHLGY